MNLRPKWDRLNNSRYEIKEGGKNITKARKHYIFLEFPVAMLRFLKFFISLSLKCTYIANLFFFSQFLDESIIFSIIFSKHQFNFSSIKVVKNIIGLVTFIGSLRIRILLHQYHLKRHPKNPESQNHSHKDMEWRFLHFFSRYEILKFF